MREADEKSTFGWSTKPLADLAVAIQYGYTAKAKASANGIRYLRITDIQGARVDWQSVPSCDVGEDESKKYLLSEGDLVFARTGATVGKSYLIRGSVPKSVFASYLIRVRMKEGIDPRYVAYFFQSPSYWQQIAESAAGIGQPNVNGTKLAQIRVPVAPPDQQIKIVEEIDKQFSRLDEAVANLQRVKANLKRYKAAVLKAAVEGRLVETEASIARREGRSYEKGEQLLQRILEERRKQWSGRGKYKPPQPPADTDASLPEGWVWASLDQLHLQIADVDHKMPKAQASGVPYVSTKDFFGDEGIDFEVAKRISAEDFDSLCRKVRPEKGDVLFSRYGTVGEVRSVTVDRPFQASYSVAILKPVRDGVEVPYLVAGLRSDVVQAQVKRDVRATAQPDLGLAHLRAFKLPLPPLAEQVRIISELDRRLSILREVEVEVAANLARSQVMRNSVLFRFFRAV